MPHLRKISMWDSRPRLSARVKLDRLSSAPRVPHSCGSCARVGFHKGEHNGVLRLPVARALTFATVLTTLVLSACRLDMQVQPRQNPLSRSDFYSTALERPIVGRHGGRGQLHEIRTSIPARSAQSWRRYALPCDQRSAQRGQERYNIFCAPCHSRLGRRQRLRALARIFKNAPSISHSLACRGRPWGNFLTSSPKVSESCPTTRRRFRRRIVGTIVRPTFAPCQVEPERNMNDVPSGAKYSLRAVEVRRARHGGQVFQQYCLKTIRSPRVLSPEL